MRQRLLQVVHRPFELQGAKHPLRDVAIVHPHHAQPHRAEERLDDHVAAELGEGLHGVGGPLAGDGARGGQAGAGQKGRGEELVHRPLDRVRPVDRAHADSAQRVQRVDAEDDLLERASRDAAHEHDVAVVERDLVSADGEAAVDAADHPRDRREAACVSARGQGPFDLPCVPASGRTQNRDAQPRLAHRRAAGARMWAGMRTLLIDNYDSYTFNLFHLLGEVNGSEPVVVRNDELSWEELAALDVDNVVISPGPGRPEHPRDVGVSLDALSRATVPVLGVCLGHQALAHVAGGTVEHAPEVMHGRLSPIHHDGSALFAGLPQGFRAVRYHSLAVGVVPAALRVTAWTPEGVIMGLEHRVRPLLGVQFHPESVGTRHGRRMLENFRDLTLARRVRPAGARARRPPHAQPVGRPAPVGARIHHRRLDHWCEPEAVFCRALRRARARDLARQRARGPGRRALLVHRRARRPTRSGRALRRRDPHARGRSRDRGARCRRRACSTIVGTSSRACGRTPRSCRSTSPAASPGTSATSSRPSAGGARRTPRRCRTRGWCSATG